MKIGAQLYTVREFCKTPEALTETLKKVADIGYKTVQVSGVCDYGDGTWLKKELDALSLDCVLTHYSPDKLRLEPAAVVDVHNALDCKYIGIGSVKGGLDDEKYQKFVEDYKPSAELFAARGKYFMFHNHWMEFCKLSDGRRFIEAMAEDFSADIMGFTFDTYWAQFAGADSVEWIRRLSGRVPCLHLKDMACVDKVQQMRAVGEGNMNFPSIISAAEDAGTEFLLVEQDHCNGLDPFDCLASSYKYLRSLGLE